MSIEKKSLTTNRGKARKLSAKKNKPATKVSSTKLFVSRVQGGGTVKVGS